MGTTQAARAAEPPADTGQYVLGEVVVRGEQGGVDSVGTVREITAQEISNLGARTLDEALRLLPGLYVRTGAGGVPRIDMRGLRSRHVLLLLNGVPFNSAYDQQFDPTLIPVENIARIKVSYGNHSLLYGPGGMGGVINIITKAGRPGMNTWLNGEVGEEETYMGRFNFSGGEDNISFFTSGDHYERAGWPLANDYTPTSEQGDGRRDNSQKRRNNLYGNLEYRPSQDWMLAMSLSGLNGSYGIPPSTINNNKDIYAQSPKYETVEDQQGYSGQVSMGYLPSGPFSMRGWLYLNHLKENPKRFDNNTYSTMNDPSVQTYDQEQKTTVSGLNLQAAYDLKSSGLFTLALAAENNKFDNSGRIRDVATRNKNVYDWRDIDENRQVTTYWSALEYEVLLGQKLGLVGSLGYNWLNKDGGNNTGTWQFLAGANYAVWQGGSLRGSASRQTRFPSIKQLYDADDGNPELDPEYSWNFELGLEQQMAYNSTVSLTGFLQDVEDYIEKDADGVTRNHDQYRFWGVELTAQTTPIKNLWLSGSISYLNSEDMSDGTEKDELQYRPAWKIALQSKYSFDCGFAIYANWMGVDGQYYYSRKTPLQKAELDNFNLFSIKLTQELWQRFMTLYVGADNLFDVDYEDSYGYPSPGRYIYGGVELRF